MLAKPSPPVSASIIRRALHKVISDPAPRFALWVLGLLYASILFAGFLAPYPENWADRHMANAAPTPVYTFDTQGHWVWPYVFGTRRERNPETLETRFIADRSQVFPIRFLARGPVYRLFGLLPCSRHLAQVAAPGRLALLGNDMNGRDNFSRLLFGGRISLTIGFLGLLVAVPIGLVYGGLSGFFGGAIDAVMMRIAEVVMSIPTLYLLISLAALLPSSLGSSERFALVTVLLAAVGWAGLSRIIRGMTLSIKTQDYVEASRALGLSTWGLLTQHILPQTASFLVISITVGVPGYLLAESGLSFLGLGIQQPDASWGNMLKEAQDINNLLYAPWMLAPGVLIFVAVLAFNLLGDAVRDALDPKG